MRRLWIVGLFALGLLLRSGPGAAGAADPAVGELLRLLDSADKRYAQIHDYTAVMVSRQRVKEVLQDQERILLKFQRAFKVYLRWLEGPRDSSRGIFH